MNDEKITWGHISQTTAFPTDTEGFPQSDKWICAMCKAPNWKKDEYAAQATAWEDSETEPCMCEWCNPLARM